MKKKGFFSSKKNKKDKEDFYYGIQTKSIEEIKKDLEKTGETDLSGITFDDLFDTNVGKNAVQVEPDLSATQNIDLRQIMDESTKKDEFKEELIAEKPITIIVNKSSNSDEAENTDNVKYRDKLYPLHIINIDVLQSVIERESEILENKIKSQEKSDKVVQKIENNEGENLSEKTEEIDEGLNLTSKIVDAELKKIKKQIFEYGTKMIVNLLLTIVMVYIIAINNTTDVNFHTDSFIITNLVTLLLGTLVSVKVVLGGIKNLFTYKPSGDTAVAVAFIVVLVHLGYSYYDNSLIASGMTHLYTHIVLMSYFFNYLGKYIKARRIYGNIKYVLSKEQKYTVKIFEEYNVSLKMAQDILTNAPVFAYQKKCKSMDEFFKLSSVSDPSEYATRNIAPISLVLSMILAIATILMYKSVNLGVSVLAGSCCMTLVVMNTIIVNLPMKLLCRKIRQSGAMITNYESLEYLNRINAVMIDSTDLFPSGSVVLEEVKTFGKLDKNEAILYARCVMDEVGGILSGILNQIVGNREDKCVLESYTLEDDLGISGIVDGKKVLIGNRKMMTNHGVEIPENNVLSSYVKEGRNEILIAVDGEFSVMLILNYKVDIRKKNEVQKFEQSGINLIVRATDPNITSDLLTSKFQISESSINVVNGNLGNIYKKISEGVDEYSPVLASTKGRIESMANVICRAKIAKESVETLVSAQTIGALIGFVITVIITFLSVDKLDPFVITAYLLAWSLLSALVAKIKK